MRRFRMKWLSALLVLILLTTFTGGCNSIPKAGNDNVLKPALLAGFASYEEMPVQVEPAVEPYRLAEDWSNVSNYKHFEFSSAAWDLLQQNNFVVVPGVNKEFFQLYDTNDGIPNFVTTDAMLHTYHLYFNHFLETIEKDYLFTELQQLTAAMIESSQEQYTALQGTGWENASRRNIAFFAVAGKLLNNGTNVPQIVKQEVNKELELIAKHSEIEVSPVINMGSTDNYLAQLKEDYTQYIPRGHYIQSEELEKYFKAMMWYGRLTFRVKNEDETKSAVLMTVALNKQDNLNKWKTIYEPSNFFVGKSDDINYCQYEKIMEDVYGLKVNLAELSNNQEKWEKFRQEAAELEPPLINSIPVYDEKIQPDPEGEIKGFRFMGQRYTLDAAIFQMLIYDNVKENEAGAVRMLPCGLDIPAAMGAEEAYSILQERGDTTYKNYPENMRQIQEYIAGLDKQNWTQNLYWSWLYTLLPLTEEKSTGYPSFMLNQAWKYKELNTYMGSWTELKHDTILYAKQAYAKLGCCPPEKMDEKGYVEPNPFVYARLGSLARMTGEGLKERGLINEQDEKDLKRLETLAFSLQKISEKELNNEALSGKEYELISKIGENLEQFWRETLPEKEKGKIYEVENVPAGLVADVATDPENLLVLEEGTGYISEIYVLVPIDDKLQITRGGVYSYYEFPWTANNRLTDEQWQKMLDENETPPFPEWTKLFTKVIK